MSALETAQRYFDAWNSRDPEAIAATFVEGGVYQDPTSGGPLTGSAIAGYARTLFTGFPDLSFEVVSTAQTGDDGVAAQWLMKGTNTGPTPGGPPLGTSIAVPGADFIAVAGDKIRSVTGYFDQVTLFTQLGLAVNPMPAQPIGPLTFGGGVYMQGGNRTKPGAFTITKLRVRSDEEGGQVRDRGLQIGMEMLGMKGFIGFVGVGFGQHMITVTAWEDEDGPKHLLESNAHREAAKAMYRDGLTLGGSLSVCTPERIRMLVRCEECGEVADAEQAETCSKGHKFPEHDPYF